MNMCPSEDTHAEPAPPNETSENKTNDAFGYYLLAYKVNVHISVLAGCCLGMEESTNTSKRQGIISNITL